MVTSIDPNVSSSLPAVSSLNPRNKNFSLPEKHEQVPEPPILASTKQYRRD